MEAADLSVAWWQSTKDEVRLVMLLEWESKGPGSPEPAGGGAGTRQPNVWVHLGGTESGSAPRKLYIYFEPCRVTSLISSLAL